MVSKNDYTVFRMIDKIFVRDPDGNEEHFSDENIAGEWVRLDIAIRNGREALREA